MGVDSDDFDSIIRTRPSLRRHGSMVEEEGGGFSSLPPLRLPTLPGVIAYSISDSVGDSNRLLLCAHQVFVVWVFFFGGGKEGRRRKRGKRRGKEEEEEEEENQNYYFKFNLFSFPSPSLSLLFFFFLGRLL